MCQVSPVPCFGIAAALYLLTPGRRSPSPQFPMDAPPQAHPCMRCAGSSLAARCHCGVPASHQDSLWGADGFIFSLARMLDDLITSWWPAQWFLERWSSCSCRILSFQLPNFFPSSPREGSLEIPGSQSPVPSQSWWWWTRRLQATEPGLQSAQVTWIVHVSLAPLKVTR